MIVVLWDLNNGKILNQSFDPEDVTSYYLTSQQQNCGYFYSPIATTFPEDSQHVLIQNKSGVYEYRTYSTQELISQGVLNFNPKTQTIDENGNIIDLSIQQQLNNGSMTFANYQVQAFIRIDIEANSYLTTAKTANGYLVNNDAQKIAIASLSITGTNQTTLKQANLLYDSTKALEILNFCANVKTIAATAKTAIKAASTAAVVDSISFKNYL